MPQPFNASLMLVIPCYNEEARFQNQKFLGFLNQYSRINFLFVDDGSTDQTFKILEGLRQGNPTQIKLLKLAANAGKAEAVRQGLSAALKENSSGFVGFWDCDLATPLTEIPAFLEMFIQHPNAEIVLGSRVKLMGRDIKRHAYRHYLGRIFATFASMVLKLSIYDTQCGAKIFKTTETLGKILSTPFKSKWIFDVEILARYVKEKHLSPAEAENLIYELPLRQWQDVKGSKVRFQDYFAAVKELIQIYLTYR